MIMADDLAQEQEVPGVGGVGPPGEAEDGERGGPGEGVLLPRVLPPYTFTLQA